METTKNEQKEIKDGNNKPAQPDPQENMEGPVSSLVQGIKESVEENNKETKAEADKKKNENT